MYPLRDMTDEEYDHQYGEGASLHRPTYKSIFKKVVETSISIGLAILAYNQILPLMEDFKPDTLHPVAFTTVPPF